MDDLKIIDVFAVYGDFGNIGGGCLIGIFEDKNQAEKASNGRGSLDCGGDGKVLNRKAIKVNNNEFYLLELDFPIKANIVLYNKVLSETTFKVKVVGIKDAIRFMRFIRSKTEMSFKEVKELTDKVRKYGEAIVEPFHNNLNNAIFKEEFIRWKQELGDDAKIEAV
jgi:hypothetical protein